MAKLSSFKMTSVFSFIFCAWSEAVIAENTRLICILEGNGSWLGGGGTETQDLGKFKLQKDYVFSPDNKQILWMQETWLMSGDDIFEDTARKKYVFTESSTVTDSEIYYERKGIDGALLASNAPLNHYSWIETISRYSGRVAIDSYVWMQVGDLFYNYDMQASGKCEVTERKF